MKEEAATVSISEEGKRLSWNREDSRVGTRHQQHNHAQAQSDNPRKEDSVAISEERKRLSETTLREVNPDDLVFKSADGTISSFSDFVNERSERQASTAKEFMDKINELAQKSEMRDAQLLIKEPNSLGGFIYNALKEKMGEENVYELTLKLSVMISTQNPFKSIETRIADRESGRAIAEYIAQNYFDDPDEAKAFMDKINKSIKDSELRDKGYVDWGEGLVPPNPLSDVQRFRQENWDKYFGHLPDGTPTTPEETRKYNEEFDKANKACNDAYNRAAEANFYKNPAPYKTWTGPIPWEELKEYDCKYSMYKEENKAWYEEFSAKSNMVQTLINNAKQSAQSLSIQDLLAKYGININGGNQ